MEFKNNNEEITIEPVNKDIYDLEALITDGTDNYIPLKFVYPGKDKTVGVYIRPINTVEFTNASRNPREVVINVVKTALYDTKKQLIPSEVIDKLPAGVTIELYKKIAEISGIPVDEQVNEELVEKLMGF